MGSDGHEEPSIHALNIDPSATPRIAWEDERNQSFGGTSVAGGVVFNGSFYTRTVNLRDASTGMLVGALTTTGASVSSTPAIVDGSVYFGAGDSFHPFAAGIHAYWIPAALVTE
jgi:outer membrane protein assembly factor BamB